MNSRLAPIRHTQRSIARRQLRIIATEPLEHQDMMVSKVGYFPFETQQRISSAQIDMQVSAPVSQRPSQYDDIHATERRRMTYGRPSPMYPSTSADSVTDSAQADLLRIIMSPGCAGYTGQRLCKPGFRSTPSAFVRRTLAKAVPFEHATRQEIDRTCTYYDGTQKHANVSRRVNGNAVNNDDNNGVSRNSSISYHHSIPLQRSPEHPNDPHETDGMTFMTEPHVFPSVETRCEPGKHIHDIRGQIHLDDLSSVISVTPLHSDSHPDANTINIEVRGPSRETFGTLARLSPEKERSERAYTSHRSSASSGRESSVKTIVSACKGPFMKDHSSITSGPPSEVAPNGPVITAHLSSPRNRISPDIVDNLTTHKIYTRERGLSNGGIGPEECVPSKCVMSISGLTKDDLSLIASEIESTRHVAFKAHGLLHPSSNAGSGSRARSHMSNISPRRPHSALSRKTPLGFLTPLGNIIRLQKDADDLFYENSFYQRHPDSPYTADPDFEEQYMHAQGLIDAVPPGRIVMDALQAEGAACNEKFVSITTDFATCNTHAGNDDRTHQVSQATPSHEMIHAASTLPISEPRIPSPDASKERVLMDFNHREGGHSTVPNTAASDPSPDQAQRYSLLDRASSTHSVSVTDAYILEDNIGGSQSNISTSVNHSIRRPYSATTRAHNHINGYGLPDYAPQSVPYSEALQPSSASMLQGSMPKHPRSHRRLNCSLAEEEVQYDISSLERRTVFLASSLNLYASYTNRSESALLKTRRSRVQSRVLRPPKRPASAIPDSTVYGLSLWTPPCSAVAKKDAARAPTEIFRQSFRYQTAKTQVQYRAASLPVMSAIRRPAFTLQNTDGSEYLLTYGQFSAGFNEHFHSYNRTCGYVPCAEHNGICKLAKARAGVILSKLTAVKVSVQNAAVMDILYICRQFLAFTYYSSLSTVPTSYGPGEPIKNVGSYIDYLRMTISHLVHCKTVLQLSDVLSSYTSFHFFERYIDRPLCKVDIPSESKGLHALVRLSDYYLRANEHFLEYADYQQTRGSSRTLQNSINGDVLDNDLARNNMGIVCGPYFTSHDASSKKFDRTVASLWLPVNLEATVAIFSVLQRDCAGFNPPEAWSAFNRGALLSCAIALLSCTNYDAYIQTSVSAKQRDPSCSGGPLSHQDHLQTRSSTDGGANGGIRLLCRSAPSQVECTLLSILEYCIYELLHILTESHRLCSSQHLSFTQNDRTVGEEFQAKPLLEGCCFSDYYAASLYDTMVILLPHVSTHASNERFAIEGSFLVNTVATTRYQTLEAAAFVIHNMSSAQKGRYYSHIAHMALLALTLLKGLCIATASHKVVSTIFQGIVIENPFFTANCIFLLASCLTVMFDDCLDLRRDEATERLLASMPALAQKAGGQSSRDVMLTYICHDFFTIANLIIGRNTTSFVASIESNKCDKLFSNMPLDVSGVVAPFVFFFSGEAPLRDQEFAASDKRAGVFLRYCVASFVMRLSLSLLEYNRKTGFPIEEILTHTTLLQRVHNDYCIYKEFYLLIEAFDNKLFSKAGYYVS